jgi:sugar (pentulose or hexulose) kinase
VAMLVRAAEHGERLDQIVDHWVRTGPILEPNTQNAALYAERFVTYQRLYPVLRALRGPTQDRR